jgi:hypothetical protein
VKEIDVKTGYWLKDRHGNEYRKQALGIADVIKILFDEHEVPECEIVQIKELNNPNLNPEATFLRACGVDTSNGFWQDDVDKWRFKKPQLFDRYVTKSAF